MRHEGDIRRVNIEVEPLERVQTDRRSAADLVPHAAESFG